MSDSRDYTGLNPDDIVEGLKVQIESEGPALKVRGIGNGNEGGSPSPGGTTNYNDLMNKPKINGVILSGDKSWKDLGLDIDNLGGGCECPLVEIPEVLPNPEALTIEIDGKETTYDGSEAKKVVIPKVEVPDIPDIPEFPTKLPNPHKLIVTQSEQPNIEYDGSAEQYVHLPSASVIAEKDVILDVENVSSVNTTYTLSRSFKSYEYIVFTGVIAGDGYVGVPVTKWFKTSEVEVGALLPLVDVWSTEYKDGFEGKFISNTEFQIYVKAGLNSYSNFNILGMNFVQPPMNSFPLIIQQGDQVHEYTGHETVNITIPDTSKGIKNPNSLTIKQEGKDDIIYDGSVEKEITIPKQSESVDIPEKLPNPYALKLHNPDGTETAYDGSVEVQLDINSSALLANRTLLLDSTDPVLNAEYTLLRDVTDFDYIIVTADMKFASNNFTQIYETNIIDVSTIPIAKANTHTKIFTYIYGTNYSIGLWVRFLSNNKFKVTYYVRAGSVNEGDYIQDLKIYGINFKQAIGNDTPVGTILSYMGTKAPKNYLTCDGSVYNISDYPELSNHMKVEFGSINFFGGDGVSTFAVPDLRGEFLRGSGTAARNTGSGADIGVHQDATEVPTLNCYYNNFQIFAVSGESINTCSNIDKVTQQGKIIRNNEGVTQHESPNLYPCNFTIRPTNTSVLYCIKCRETYTGGSVNYSTEEHVVGKWIDGRTLYERTIEVGSISNGQTKRIEIEGADSFIPYSCFIYESIANLGQGSTRYTLNFPYQEPNHLRILDYLENDKTLVVEFSNINNYTLIDAFVKIRYAKEEA